MAKDKGNPPVGVARFNGSNESNGLYKAALEGNKGKPDPSKRGKEQYYPPGHPSYGKQNSSFFGGQGGGQRVPKNLVPLDDGMDFEFAVKMSL